MKILCCFIFLLLLLFVFLIIFFDKKILLDYAMNKELNHNVENMGSSISYEKEINKFYGKTPKNSPYIKHLEKVKNQVLNFLKKPIFKFLPNKVVVIDFDDTVAWTSPHNPNNNVTRTFFSPRYGDVFHLNKLNPMVEMVKEINKLGYNILVITARPPESLNSTWSNLEEFGINVINVCTSLYYGQDPKFKAVMRNNIEKCTLKGLLKMTSEDLYNFSPKRIPFGKLNLIMTIGDKITDIDGMSNVVGVKLPEPRDMNSYFIYNDEVKIIE